MRSAYFWRMRSASALRFSSLCSSLNFDRMMTDLKLRTGQWRDSGDGNSSGWKATNVGVCEGMNGWLGDDKEVEAPNKSGVMRRQQLNETTQRTPQPSASQGRLTNYRRLHD